MIGKFQKRTEKKPARIDLETIKEIVTTDAPFTEYYGFKVLDISYGQATVILPYAEKHVRPGGTVCGPAMFALADFTMWVAVLTIVGKVPLAVTTNLNINFLNKPQNTDLICQTDILKAGKRLMVGNMDIMAQGDEQLCAHATGTYSVPPIK